jgi:hypothetical protein
MAQVVACLPSKHEALSSNPNTAKNKTPQAGNITQWHSVCLAHAGSWVQAPVWQKKKKNPVVGLRLVQGLDFFWS